MCWENTYYKIGEDDLVFEIYYINHAMIVYYMKYEENIDLKKFYHICISCGNIHTDKIETCPGCAQTVCSECNPFNSVLCTNCDIVFNEDVENDSNIGVEFDREADFEMDDI